MMTDVSAWEPMARGGRSPHSGLLAWLARYVKQLLLIWSPQSRAFGGLVRRPVRPSAGASGPGTELGEARSPREARAGQEGELLAPPAHQCVFPRRAGFMGRGSARPGVASSAGRTA